ncbi:beta-defensin 134 [Ochotona princeps]|uniref:beta-defensin 134 n=1 Tax=Ochotona princeps TaxID=9978 RepID=UPI00064C2D44|nr:beta-defensin 134 [Ochotona princeps]XP_040822252.1 beta-defensin 134 [Ochotona curzoniae]
MKSLLIVVVLLSSWDAALAGFNLISPEWRKKCSENGVCRFECYGSEMLVDYCMSRLECCVRGNPVP